MTDKQIKEEIKHINTRNQEYIAENNKMTKKIIDGVDVSGCIFFEIHYLEDEDVKIKEFCRIIHCDCDSNPNCYYKQLQREHLFSRKEQECEKLKKTIKLQNEMQMEVCEEKNEEIEKLKTENEKLKKIIDEAKNSNIDLKSFLVGEAVQNEYEQQLDQLKQTLTEIKEVMKKHCRKCKKHKFYNFKLCCTCKYTDILQKISEYEVENERN